MTLNMTKYTELEVTVTRLLESTKSIQSREFHVSKLIVYVWTVHKPYGQFFWTAICVKNHPIAL